MPLKLTCYVCTPITISKRALSIYIPAKLYNEGRKMISITLLSCWISRDHVWNELSWYKVLLDLVKSMLYIFDRGNRFVKIFSLKQFFRCKKQINREFFSFRGKSFNPRQNKAYKSCLTYINNFSVNLLKRNYFINKLSK